MKQWEEYGDNVHRMEVEGGYLYNSVKGLAFVPNDDIQVELNRIAYVLESITGTDNHGNNGFIRVGVET